MQNWQVFLLRKISNVQTHPWIHRLGPLGSYISVGSAAQNLSKTPVAKPFTSHLHNPSTCVTLAWDGLGCHQCSYIVVGFKRLSWNSAVTLNLEPQRCSEGNLVWKTSWYVQQISKSMVLLPNSKLARGCCPSTRGLLKFFRPSTTTTRSWYNIIAPNCRLWSSCYRGGLQHGKCVHPNFWGQHTKNIKRHLKHTPLKINMEHNHGGLLNGWFVGSMWIFRGVWRC